MKHKRTATPMVKFAALAIGVLFIMYLAIWPMQVDGISMEPTLADGEIIWTSYVAPWLSPAQKGDIVICIHPDTGKKLVKRLVAVSGDHIVIKDEVLRINGIDIQKISGATNLDWFIPTGQVFVLGDNGAFSEDSRLFGCLDERTIIRKVLK